MSSIRLSLAPGLKVCYNKYVSDERESMSAPMEFPGTSDEKAANYNTHIWFDGRCGDCDCNSWGITSEWPCGTSVPRVENPNAGDEQLLRFQVFALAHSFNDAEREDS